MNISIFVYDRMYVDLDSDNVANLQETLSIIRNSDMRTYVLHQHYQPLLESNDFPRVEITRGSQENARGTFSPPIFLGNYS
jgi:hypothetical protein